MVSRVSLVGTHLVGDKIPSTNKKMKWVTTKPVFFLVSFSGLMFLAFYIAGKMKMFDQKGVSKSFKLK